ncbi:MAG: pyroglutamyl-peptidase I [Anaerolineales bacterium]|nr:pyroglutamyl-peptidase I [Anaerolineales bacterium]
MKLLLTGFEPFGQNSANPTQHLVETLAARPPSPGVKLIARVLPVEYVNAEQQLQALIHAHRPDVILSLGLAESRAKISLERVALNLDDASLPDNAGELRQGTPICPEAPAAYFSTLPLDSLKIALENAEIPVHISNHAGAYLCNHIFYVARHEVESLGIPCGFVHMPQAKEFAPANENALPLDTLLRAVEICIQTLSD